jgi:hypothetical protein
MPSSSSEKIKHIPQGINILVNHYRPRGSRKLWAWEGHTQAVGRSRMLKANSHILRCAPSMAHYREHLQRINKLLQLSVYNSVRYTYSTPKNSQRFFYIQETSIISYRFFIIFVLPDDGPIRPETCMS